MSELIERAIDEGVGSEKFANVENALEKFPMQIRGCVTYALSAVLLPTESLGRRSCRCSPRNCTFETFARVDLRADRSERLLVAVDAYATRTGVCVDAYNARGHLPVGRRIFEAFFKINGMHDHRARLTVRERSTTMYPLFCAKTRIKQQCYSFLVLCNL